MKLYDVVSWQPDRDQDNIVVYRHPTTDFNTHTQLIVYHGQLAIFVKNGHALDVFGEGKHTLSTDKLPILGKMMNWTTGGQEQFHCEVYFVKETDFTRLIWGTRNPVPMIDPVEQVQVHLRANGGFGVKVKNPTQFLKKIVGTQSTYTQVEIASLLRDKLIERVKGLLAQVVTKQNVGVLEINAYLQPLSDELKTQLAPFFEDYGLELILFSVTDLLPLDEDLRAINEARIAARKMDLESEAMARKRQREGYTYQNERSYDVLGTAAANKGMAGNMMGAGMGLGMGFGIGGAFAGGMGNLGQSLNFNGAPQAPNMQTAAAGAAVGAAAGIGAEAGAAAAVCGKCGAQLAQGAKFCNVCGAPQSAPAPQVAHCVKCGAELPAGAKFCNMCGAKQVNTCVNCGKELPFGAKFCNECGAKQTEE